MIHGMILQDTFAAVFVDSDTRLPFELFAFVPSQDIPQQISWTRIDTRFASVSLWKTMGHPEMQWFVIICHHFSFQHRRFLHAHSKFLGFDHPNFLDNNESSFFGGLYHLYLCNSMYSECGWFPTPIFLVTKNCDLTSSWPPDNWCKPLDRVERRSASTASVHYQDQCKFVELKKNR